MEDDGRVESMMGEHDKCYMRIKMLSNVFLSGRREVASPVEAERSLQVAMLLFSQCFFEMVTILSFQHSRLLIVGIVSLP